MAAVGLLTLHLHLEHSHSLKDKRQVLRGLKDRLRSRFNVAVSEIGFQDTWQRSVVAVATVSESEKRVEEVLQRVEAEASRFLGGDLATSEVELL